MEEGWSDLTIERGILTLIKGNYQSSIQIWTKDLLKRLIDSW